MQRYFETMNEDAILPKRATANSAGYDFFMPRDIDIPPLSLVKTELGVRAHMEPDDVLFMYMRSSLGKKGLILANGTGVIDADYYGNESNGGEIGALLYNMSDVSISIKRGERVVQGVFTKYLKTDGDESTQTRTGGWGSTE